MCQCPVGYGGVYCKQHLSKCPVFDTVFKTGLFHSTQLFDGSITTWMCGAGMTPSVNFSICQTNYWVPSPLCYKVPPTTTSKKIYTQLNICYTAPTPSYSSKYFTSNVKHVFITCICLAHLVTPLLLYYYTRKCYAKISKIDHKASSDLKALKTKALHVDKAVLSQNDSHLTEEILKKLNDIEQQLTKAIEEANARRQRRQCVTNQKSLGLFRVTSYFCYWSSWGWIIYLIISLYLNFSDSDALFSTLNKLSIIFISILIAIVLIESFMCSEFQILRNLSSVSSAAELIEQIRISQPSIVMSAVFYHYETRTRTVYYMDGSGRNKKRQENYQEKVVSAAVEQPYLFSHWQDQSPKTLINADKQTITKVNMQLCVLFGDIDTLVDFYVCYVLFKNKYSHRDTLVDFTIKRDVVGYEKSLELYTDAKKKSFWIKLTWYIICVMLHLGWIYRILFNKVVGRSEYKVVKLIYRNRPSNDNLIEPNVLDAETLINTNSNESEVLPLSLDSLIKIRRNNITLLLRELQEIASNNANVNNGDNGEETPLMLVTRPNFKNFAAGERSELHQTI